VGKKWTNPEFTRDSPFGRLFKQREAHILQAANDELYFVKVGAHHSKDKMLAIVNMLVDGAELCEHIIGNELPPRLSRRKTLPSVAQYLTEAQARDKKQIAEMRASGWETFIVMLLGLMCLLPLICLALFWLMSLTMQPPP
jgi:hypothetical protein